MHTTFSDSDVAAMLRIAGEVAEIGQDWHSRRTHVLNRLLGLVGGCWAVCSEIDPLRAGNSGWAVPDSITCAGKLSAYQQEIINRYLSGDLAALDPCIPPLLREKKPVATVRRADVADNSWFRSDHFNHVRRPLGFGESLYGVLTTPDRRRLKLSMHRELNDSPFTEHHVRLIQIFNENLGSLYIGTPSRQDLHDRPPQRDARLKTLPPRLRPVLQRLLTGDSEKQVALKLGLSRHTVHEYVKTIYRRLGAASRAELLSQFVVMS